MQQFTEIFGKDREQRRRQEMPNFFFTEAVFKTAVGGEQSWPRSQPGGRVWDVHGRRPVGCEAQLTPPCACPAQSMALCLVLLRCS